MRKSLAVFWKCCLSVFLHAMLFRIARGETHSYNFVLKETNFTKLCDTKSTLTVNDSFPGPVIRVHRGDTIYVNVHNHGYYGVTLHWHGVKLMGNPWSDGPDYITQCSIPAGTNFTYEVEFSVEEGTLWWHAHSYWTQATVHGAIVVLPPIGESYPFPLPYKEEVIVFGSWYTGNLRQLVAEALLSGEDLPVSNANTINGEPGDFCNCSKETTRHFAVDYGKTYLFRLVNAAPNGNLFFSIAQHSVTVVGMDGAYIKPFASNYVMLDVGRTMDVLVTANQSVDQYYYMVARQYSSSAQDISTFDASNASAILKYNRDYDPPTSPLLPSSLPSYKDYDAAYDFVDKVKSLANEKYPIDVPRNITTRMYVVVSMGRIPCSANESCTDVSDNRLASSMNNISWMDPKLDVLQAYYRKISGVYSDDFPNDSNYFNFTGDDIPISDTIPMRDTKVKMLNYGEAVEIVLQTTNTFDQAEDHPIHLHGHSFYVVGKGSGNFDEQTDPTTYNLIDPPYLNTVGVHRKGWATIRFFADNPGVWFFHCHYLRHLSWGMNTVFIVKNGGSAGTSMRPPPVYMPPCNVSSPHPLLEFPNISYETIYYNIN